MVPIARRFILIILLPLILLVSCPLPQGETDEYIVTVLDDMGSQLDYRAKSTDWTVMLYVDGDNNLESLLLQDIYELSQGMESTEMMNVIALVDRIDGESGNSTILGSDFTDTRLFRVGADEIYDLSGEGEAYFPGIDAESGEEYNMGDIETLKTFIEYSKAYYPADHYGLIFSNHGSGLYPAGSSDSSSSARESSADELVSKADSRAIAYDDTSGEDALNIAELTDVLDDSYSVDLLVFDACVMGLAEIAYEYRPGTGRFSADYMAASVPNVWGEGLPYDLIFKRISQVKTGGTGRYSGVTGSSVETRYYDPATMTAAEFGQIIVEEQERDTQDLNAYSSQADSQSFALYDLSKVGDVVYYLDEAAKDLTSYTSTDLYNLRSACLSYEEDPIFYPHYDFYDFADNLGDADLISTVDSMVLASFGGSSFSGFTEGENGLGFFFPNGDTAYGSAAYWAYQWWYTGVDVNTWWPDHYYGNLDFCHADGDGTVDGWFELLQYIYNNPYDDNAHPGQW